MEILLALGNNKTKLYSESKTYNKNCVGIINENRYLQLTDNGSREIILKTGNIEPLIPVVDCNIETKLLERFVILISGSAGDGKSVLASLFVNQYMHSYGDKRKIFRISMKDINVDRNFKLFKNIINLDIVDDLPNIQNILDIPINCLFIIDDADNNKQVYRILNLLCELGRERGVSVIFITHYNSKLGDSSIYKECNIYITFHNNMMNNRMLEHHYNIDKKIIDWLKELNQVIYVFNKINQTIICNNFTCKLNSLTYSKDDQKEIIELLN
jgi:hypothetical protein